MANWITEGSATTNVEEPETSLLTVTPSCTLQATPLPKRKISRRRPVLKKRSRDELHEVKLENEKIKALLLKEGLLREEMRSTSYLIYKRR